MKSITIHGMDDELAASLERRAREKGLSLNKAIKNLLAEALGLKPGRTAGRRLEFEHFCGAWSPTDADEFRKAIADFEKIEPGDWT